MKEIKLTQGQIALVDDEDFEYLSQWKWYASKQNDSSFIAVRNARKAEYIDGVRYRIFMSRVIMNTPIDLVVDHRDHNPLNNQKYNLRNCSYSQNSQNMKLNYEGLYYKGVAWHKASRKWQAHIQVNGKLTHLGSFENEENAALVYNTAAVKHFGEFAYLNKLKEKTNASQL